MVIVVFIFLQLAGVTHLLRREREILVRCVSRDAVERGDGKLR